MKKQKRVTVYISPDGTGTESPPATGDFWGVLVWESWLASWTQPIGMALYRNVVDATKPQKTKLTKKHHRSSPHV